MRMHLHRHDDAHRHGTTTAADPRTAGVHHHHLAASTAVPVVGGLAYGLYAALLNEGNGASAISSLLIGVVAAIVTAGLGTLLMHRQSALLTEVRALAYGALFGSTMGFLYSLAGPGSILKSTGMGLTFGILMFAVSLYFFRAHGAPEPEEALERRRASMARRTGRRIG